MQDYKKCPTCQTTNNSSDASCKKCKRDLGDVDVTKTLGTTAPQSTLPPTNPSSPPHEQKYGSLAKIGCVLFSIIVLVPILFLAQSFISRRNPSPTRTATATVSKNHLTVTPPPQALGIFSLNDETLGINDGSFTPFLLKNIKQEFALKLEAADQLQSKNSSQAIALWQAALKIVTNDAEALIYLEDQRILLTGLPYMTLVAGTDLSIPSGSNDLQGIYVAQHEFNASNHDYQLRILIANSGVDPGNVSTITQRIVQLATQDKTVVGAISWLTSTENLAALPILSKAHIPLISPAASSDALTDSSKYFFRVVPPNQVQGKADALFAEKTLKAKKVVVFIDNKDTYSQNLAQDFEHQFISDGNIVVKEETFTTDHTSKIGDLIRDALKTNPDLLYFTSRDTPDSANFQDALPISGPFAHLPALAGDAGYVIHKNGFGRWFFIAFAFADEWVSIMGKGQHHFYQEYNKDFNPDNIKPLGYYGYTRPLDISILSYDVTSVFEDALHIAITKGNITVTPDGLAGLTPDTIDTALSQITGPQAWQGVSGLISFDSHNNPADKAIVILSASSDGYTHMNGWEGCFAIHVCQGS